MRTAALLFPLFFSFLFFFFSFQFFFFSFLFFSFLFFTSQIKDENWQTCTCCYIAFLLRNLLLTTSRIVCQDQSHRGCVDGASATRRVCTRTTHSRVLRWWTRLQCLLAGIVDLFYFFFFIFFFKKINLSHHLATQAFRAAETINDPVVIGSSLGRRVAGLGLFAQRSYKRGERITAYGGRVLSIEEARALWRRTHMRSMETMRRTVDGSSGYRRRREPTSGYIVGLAQFAKTSAERNINCCAVPEEDAAKLHTIAVWLVAARDIALGEEFFVSYGRSFHRAVGVQQRRYRPANRTGNNAMLWSKRDVVDEDVSACADGDDGSVADRLRMRKRKHTDSTKVD
jgi:hypothetical protein